MFHHKTAAERLCEQHRDQQAIRNRLAQAEADVAYLAMMSEIELDTEEGDDE